MTQKTIIQIAGIVILAVMFIAIAGCTQASDSNTQTLYPSVVVGCERGEYNWIECSGIVGNPTDENLDVFGYVDFYKSGGTKIDHVIFEANPDAGGSATFEVTSMVAEKYPVGSINAKAYITDSYVRRS